MLEVKLLLFWCSFRYNFGFIVFKIVLLSLSLIGVVGKLPIRKEVNNIDTCGTWMCWELLTIQHNVGTKKIEFCDFSATTNKSTSPKSWSFIYLVTKLKVKENFILKTKINNHETKTVFAQFSQPNFASWIQPNCSHFINVIPVYFDRRDGENIQ